MIIIPMNCAGENIVEQNKKRIRNIKLENTIPNFFHYCEWCMSCIHNCPKRAIHIKNEINDERFINSDISLNEIIRSNEQ